MNKLIILLAVVCGVFGGVIALGYKLLGLPGVLVGFVACALIIKGVLAYGKRRMMHFGKAMFDAKSRVLRGATIEVHQVASAPARQVDHDDEDEEHEVRGPTKFYFLDVTIAPPTSGDATPFGCWDSTELQLVAFDAPAPTFEDGDTASDAFPNCEIHEVTHLDTERGEEAGKNSGSQRLQLHIEVPTELKRLKFQYYFETFGDVRMP